MTNAPPILYHYTTFDALVGILESRELWATSLRHLNDSSEFRYTIDLARQETLDMPRGASGSYGVFLDAFREALAGMEDGTAYVTSFSAIPDLLSQWRGYGQPGLGVALGVQTADLIRVAQVSGYHLERCEYQRDIQLQTLREAFQAAASPPHPLAFGLRVLALAPTFKHSSFSEEAEWRLISGRPATGALAFRRVGSLAVPYRRVPFVLDDSLPLAELVLAPTPHPVENELALKLLLSRHGLSHVPVLHSSIPYRTR